MSALSSRDNPRVRRWTKLVQDARYRRTERHVVLEGPHLLQALLDSGARPVALLATDTALAKQEIASLVQRAKLEPVILSRSLFDAVVDSETPQGIAAEIALPDTSPDLYESETCVFLEGVQDAGNVGSILRSAAAFGIRDIVLAKGCADVWSPKVLRAAAGSHFRLRIADHVEPRAAFQRFRGRVLCTMPRGGVPLPQANLDGPIGWVFGAEGQGVSGDAEKRADLRVTIPIAAQSESLNVAIAAALCFYETARRRRQACH
jgi:RNA methyltransferase, TrmH family